MKDVDMKVVFDDIGGYIYNIDGKYLSPYMYFLYKVIIGTEERKKIASYISEDLSKYDKKIKNYRDELNELLDMDNGASVGPFFYIHNKIYIKNKKLTEFDKKLEFFDNEIGHFEWFYNELVNDRELNLDETTDYGEFLRGRVLYDSKKNIFKFYANPKILLNHILREEILKLFNIKESKYACIFLFDEHYLLDSECPKDE